MVVKVVEKEIGDGGLGGTADQSRMMLRQCGGGIESGVGDAPHADFLVVAVDVVDQPLDGVVGVVAFIAGSGGRVGSGRRVVDVGPHVVVGAFGHPTSAHVLMDEDVALVFHDGGRSDAWVDAVLAVGLASVGGSHQ